MSGGGGFFSKPNNEPPSRTHTHMIFETIKLSQPAPGGSPDAAVSHGQSVECTVETQARAKCGMHSRNASTGKVWNAQSDPAQCVKFIPVERNSNCFGSRGIAAASQIVLR